MKSLIISIVDGNVSQNKTDGYTIGTTKALPGSFTYYFTIS